MRTAPPFVAAMLVAALAAPSAAQEAKKLSDPTVPTATTVGATDLFYILQGATGKKISGANLGSALTDLLTMDGASCSAGNYVSAISPSGAGTCTAEVGDISGVTAGTSLTGGGTTGAVTLNVALPGASCSATQFVTAISASGAGTCSSVPSDFITHHDEIDAATVPTDQQCLAWDTDTQVFNWQSCALTGDLASYALLNGRAGGQTLAGGTSSGDDLSLFANSGAGNPPTLILDGTNERFDFLAGFGTYGRWDGFALQTNTMFQIPVAASASATCISRDATNDHLYHDTDCDDTEDAGERDLSQPDTYTLTVEASSALSMTDAQTLYFGHRFAEAPNVTGGEQRVYVPLDGTITGAYIYAFATTAGSAEGWTLYVRLNNTTDTAIAVSSVSSQHRTWQTNGLSIAVTAGEYVEIKSVNPTWATNPAGVRFAGTLVVTR